MKRVNKKIGVHGTDAETGRAKKCCPIARKRFMEKALPLVLRTDGPQCQAAVTVGPKVFASGSFGWYWNQKCMVLVDGKYCRAGIQVTVTLDHSKEESQSADEAPEAVSPPDVAVDPNAGNSVDE